MSEFKWRQFEGEIILWAVRWYCRYGISYRDLEHMMGERGVSVDHSTIYRWVQRFAPEIEKRLRWQWRRPQSTSWRVDETYVKGLCCKNFRNARRHTRRGAAFRLPTQHLGASKIFATEPQGVQLRIADYDKPETLVAALDKVSRLLLISSNAVGPRLTQHQNVINAAKQAGVDLIAYTSILHADTSPMPLAIGHLPTEAALKAAGVPFVLLRNGWYTENYGFTINPALKEGVYRGSAGDGRISSAARADYAEAAAVILSTEGHENKTYELAGDDSFTLSELSAAISGLTGRQVTYQNVSENELKASLLQRGLPEAMASTVAACDTSIAIGGLEDRSHELSRLIGRPTTPYRQSLREIIAAG